MQQNVVAVTEHARTLSNLVDVVVDREHKNVLCSCCLIFDRHKNIAFRSGE